METYPMKKSLPYILMFLAISQTSFGLNVFSQLISAQLENKATDYSTGVRGRIWYNTASEKIRFDTGSAYKSIVTEDGTQTLTNKTIDADSNTITNIENADIKSGAAIGRSKIASGTANYVVINDSGGALASEATLATSRGGTNLSSYVAGALLYAPSTNVVSELAIGTAGQVLKVSGGLPSWGAAASALAVTSKSIDYTVLGTDDFISVDTSSGNRTMTLPACASNSGKVLHFKKSTTDANKVTVARAGSDNINGSTSLLLPVASESASIVCDGSSTWHVLDSDAKVVAIYETNTASAMTTSAATIVNFEDQVTDTHSAVSTGASWTFTAPRTDFYRVSSTIVSGLSTGDNWALTESFEIRVYKNGSFLRTLGRTEAQVTGNFVMSSNGSTLVPMSSGDTINIRVFHDYGANVGLSGGAEKNWVTIESVNGK